MHMFVDLSEICSILWWSHNFILSSYHLIAHICSYSNLDISRSDGYGYSLSFLGQAGYSYICLPDYYTYVKKLSASCAWLCM